MSRPDPPPRQAVNDSEKIAFLDTFVTIEQTGSEPVVRFEGEHEMVSIVHFGLIIAWHGPDLQRPDRPPPALFTESVGDGYYMSKKVHYPDDEPTPGQKKFKKVAAPA